MRNRASFLRASRFSVIMRFVLASLWMQDAALAQTGTPPPATVRPAPEIKAPSAPSQDEWRRTMTRTPLPKSGCFTSSYPSTQWQEVPCTTAPARPYPPRGPRPMTVGNTVDVAADVAPDTLSLTTGSFDSVVGVTNETDLSTGAPNTFSLQINANFFDTPACIGANPNSKNPLSPTCVGWQQFVFSNSACAHGLTCASVFIQYWLINFGPKCPAKGGAVSGWMTTPLSPDSCFANSAAAPVLPQTIAGLANFNLTGTTSTGSDAVFMSVGNPAILSAMGGPGSVLGLAGLWHQAEFNVFGDANDNTAKFNAGSTLVVRTSVDRGSSAAPSCVSNQVSFTGEMNNLTLTSPPALVAGQFPALVFKESNAAGAVAAAPLCSAGVTTVAAPPAPPTIPVFRCLQATSNLNGAYGVGMLVTHPEFCSASGPTVPPPAAPPPSYVATPITNLPLAAGLQAFVCNQFSPNLSASYGIGIVTADPQFCWNGGPGGPTVAPSIVPPSVATDTGLKAGTLPIFRCNHARTSAPYGIGVLTTHPQFCAPNGPTPPPGIVPASVAVNLGPSWFVR